jgi:uroporphyrinogen decarboxylase
MTNLDRFYAVMEYGDFDHPPFFWPQTMARWRAEGLTADRPWQEVLGITELNFYWHGFNHTAYPPFEKKVLQDTPEHRIYIDDYGRTVRDLKKTMSMPEWIDLPVKDRASFVEMLTRFSTHDVEKRLAGDFAKRIEKINSPDFDGFLTPPAGNYYFTMDSMIGVETAAYMFVDCPDLVHQLFENICECCCWFIRKLGPLIPGRLRCLGTGEDLAFKNGPFFSPAMFEEFFVPRYRRVWKIAQEQGAKFFFIDTDGNFTLLLPQMVEAGMNIFCPMEVAAGMEPAEIRRRFGRQVRMVGGVDKRILAAGKDAIRAELLRLLPLMREGGFVPKVDHSVPSDVSWDNFRYYIDTLREMHRLCATR